MTAAEASRIWRAKNPERHKATARRYRKANLEKVRAYHRAYMKKNRAKYYDAEKATASATKWRKQNPERARINFSRSRYKRNGMDPVEAARVRREHSGCCDCCGRDKSGGNGWAVDHDHTTGRVRGVLCNWCNTAIGRLGDTLEGVLKAVRYLEKSKEKRND